MIDQDLINYIKKALLGNISAEKIKEELFKVGWENEVVESAFKEVESLSISDISQKQELNNSQKIEQKNLAVNSNEKEVHKIFLNIQDELKSIKKSLENQDQKLNKLEAEQKNQQEKTLILEKGFNTLGALAQSINKSTVILPPIYTPLATIPAPISSLVPVKKESAETKIAGKWFAIIGILAILFGVSFFLKYAFENNWIGETGRVILGICVGIGLLILGDILRLKEKYVQYSHFISGGGIALLYLSILGAFHFYKLISQPTAFGFMFFVTVAGAIISLRTKAEDLAFISILGGFLTPILISTGIPNQIGLFGFILILNIGVLILLSFKKWRKIYFLSFTGTYLYFFGWYNEYYTVEKLLPTFSFLTAFFVILLITPFLLSLFSKRKSSIFEIIISFLNSIIYFSVSYNLLADKYNPVLGFFFVIWSALLLFGAYLIYKLNTEDKLGITALGAVGLFCLTSAIPAQFNENTLITVSWAAEGFVLTWVGLKFKNYSLRIFADIVFVLTSFLLFNEIIERSVEHSFLNFRFFVTLIVIASFYSALYFYKIYQQNTEQEKKEYIFPAILFFAANFFSLFILSVETSEFFSKKVELLQKPISPSVFEENSSITEQQISQINKLEYLGNLSLSILWLIYSSVWMLFGILKRLKLARIGALVVFIITILKVFFVDIGQLAEIYRIISFIALGVILLAVSFLTYRYKDKIKEFILVS